MSFMTFIYFTFPKIFAFPKLAKIPQKLNYLLI